MKNITRVLFLLLCTFLFTTNVNAQRSPSLGTIDYFSDALTSTIRTVRLSDDKILVTWLDNGSSSSNNLKAIVGTVSGTSVTFTPSDEVTITSNVFTTSHGLVSFSSTKAAIIYEANLATDEMKYNVLDITGTTIVVGGQDDFGPSGGLQVGTTKASSAVAISDTQLVVTYEEDIGANDVFKVMAGTVSGTTITWGTAISPNSDDGNNADVVRLTDSKFALAYEDQTTSTGAGRLIVGTVDGSNGITFGIEETFADSFDINIAKLAALSETEVVVVWEYITGTQYASARYATISGTGITFPTQTIPTFYTDEGVDDMAIAALSGTEFIVAVDGGSGDDSEVYTGVVSSNNITMTSDGGSVIITGQADDIQIAPLTSDKAVVVYTNDQAVGTTTADRGDYVVASYTATTNPEINVQGNSVDIVSGDDTPSTGDHTDFGTGNPISRTFTIQNTGTGTLTLGSNAVTITGTNASEFTVTSQPATTVSSSSSTTFTVEFSSLVASTRTAQININSDDVHESNYFFDIEGIGAAAPSNNAPTDITLTPDTVGQSTTGVDAVVGALTSTDADGGDSHTYSLVAGSGDTDNGSFNIDGSNLRTDTALAPGSYSVRINTNDGTDDFADAISVTITDDVAPSGYSVTIDQSPINAGNDNAVSFTFASAEVGATYNYTFTSSGGAGSVSNSGVIATATDQISGIDISGLPDGTITLSVTLTDTNANTGSAATDTETKDAAAPTGYSVTIDQSPINAGNDNAVSFTFASAEVGATYNYTFTSSGGAGSVSNSGVIATATDQISGIDISGLPDGTITLSVTLTDTNGNTGSAATDTETKDAAAPTGYSVTIDQSPINAGNDDAVSFTFAGAEVGATYNYTFTSSGGAGSVANSGVIATATDQITGIDISGLPDGTITLSVTLTDTNGNTGSVVTDTETKETVAPTGYSVSIDQSPIDAANDDAVSFTFAGAEVGATYNYTFTSSGGAGSVSNSGVIATATDQITGIDISGLPDGTITLSVTLTDVNGNIGSAATDTESKDALAPSGYSVTIDQSPINAGNDNAVSFTFAGAEVGTTYNYTFTSSGGAGSVANSGVIATATDQITGIDISGLPDGTITLSVTLTDTGGNTGSAATDTETKDTAAPTGYSVSIDQSPINSGNESAVSFTFAGAEVGATYNYTFTSSGGAGSVSNSGVISTATDQITGIDISGLPDGTITLSVTLTDTNGNTGSAATDTETKDATAPTGYSVTIDQSPINAGNDNAVSFTFASAEVGATYNYTFTSSGGAGSVSNSGVIATATDQITGIDISGLPDGTITLSVTLTDTNGNTGSAATDTETKDTAAPTGYSVSIDQSPINSGNETAVSFTFAGAEVGTTYNYTFTSSGGAGSVSNSGVISTATDQITGIDISGLPDGTITLSVTLTDTNGNTGSAATDTETKETVPPSGYSVTIDQSPIDAGNDDAVSFTFANAEVGATYNYTFTSSGGAGSVSNSGVISTATDQITGIDISGLPDGTITLSVTLTDVNGNTGSAATDTESKDATAPSGYSVTIDQSPINSGNETAVSFTFAGAEVGATYNYTFTSSGGAGSVSNSGVISTATDQITGIDLSGLPDGTITLSVTLTDTGGNTGSAATDTETKDSTAPTGYSVSIDQSPINAGNESAVSFTFAGAEVGATYNYTFTSSGGAGSVSNSGLISTATDQITGIDISGLPDGTITLSVTLTDTNGNTGSAATDTETKDATAPTGYSVTIDQSPINSGNESAVSFTFASAEVGATYNYTFTSSGGAGSVSNSGAISTATDQITGIDISGLPDGTITLSVTLTDTNGNTGSAATDTETKDTAAPTGYSVSIDQSPIDPTNASAVSFTFAGAEVGATYNYTFTSDGGAGSVTNSGLIATATDQITGIDISGLPDGTITLSVTLTDTNGNTGTAATDTETKNTVISGSIDDPTVAEGDAGSATLTYTVSLDFPAPTGGASFAYATSDGTASSASDYTMTSGTVNFAAGETSQTIDVTVSGDEIVELDETIIVTLTSPTGTNVTIADATGTGTITNDDSTVVTVEDISHQEDGTFVLTLTSSNAVDGGFSLGVSTVDVTATAGDDYTALVGEPVTFNGMTAGETMDVTITVVDDGIVEADEIIGVGLGGLSPVTVASGNINITDTAAATIENNDSANVTIADVNVTEADGTATVVLTLDNDVDGGLTVNVNTTDGTATSASDYTAVTSSPQVFTGTAGETINVNINITDDSIGEETESFTVSMAGTTAPTVAANTIDITDTADVTILDDDAPQVTALSPMDDAVDVVISTDLTITFNQNVVVGTGNILIRNVSDDSVIETIDVTGSAVSIASNVVTINPTADLPSETDIYVEVPADAFENGSGQGNDAIAGNTAWNFTTEDITAPTVVVSTNVGSPTNIVFTATFTFSEPITGFDLTDINLTNATASIFNLISPTEYTALITPSAEGEVTVSILAGALQDTSSNANDNEASNVVSIIYDITDPTLDITTTANDPTNLNPIPVTFTFSEDMDSFEAADLMLTNATIDNFQTVSASVFTADILPIADGDVIISLEGDATEDLAGNPNEEATFSIEYDATPPTVVISSTVPDPTNGAFDVTITFSEDVVGLALNVIQFSNGIPSNFVASNSEATVTITPVADDPVTVFVPPNAVQDLAGNGNLASNLFEVVYDATRPTVVITTDAADPTNIAFTATFTFSEDVTGFEMADIVFDNATPSGFNPVSATEYTVLVTPTDDGTVTIDVPENVAEDAATNGNEASDQYSVEYDATRPTVDITATVADPINVPFDITITFDEDVTGFEMADLVVTNATPSNFAGSGSVYTVTITPDADGSVTIEVPENVAEDAATNGNEASDVFDITYDATRPVPTITSTVADPTNVAFDITITFTEDVTGFVMADLDVVNATPSNFGGSGAVYTVTITPDADGGVTIIVPENVSEDAATNGNEASNEFSVTYDATNPEVVITTNAQDPTNLASFTATFTFSEAVTGFDTADITVTNAALTDFDATNAPIYTATITPAADGLVTIDVAAAAAQDAATNTNAAVQFTIESDQTRPTVTITSSVPDPTNAAFDITITFSEDVFDFTVDDIDVGNGTASNFGGSGAMYTATITPTADGGVTVLIPEAVTEDAATNPNEASNEFFVDFDGTNPTAVMSTTAAEPVNAPFTVDILFDENVFGFEMADLVVTNGTPSDFAVVTPTTAFSVLITPTGQGDVIVEIPAGVTEDLATNPNNAASFTIIYDNIPPLPPNITHISDYTCSGDVNQTSDNTLEIFGTAEGESVVEVFIDGVSLGTVITDANTGFFMFDYTGTTLADGTYSFTAQATDAALNTGDLSAPLTITINTVDSDGDGNPDFCDEDDNGNGTVDAEEDCDGDGIIDSQDTDNSTCREPIQQRRSYGFSPNGDGVNESWVIENITAFPNNVVQVFNRSGNLVFKQNSYQNDWQAVSNQLSGNTFGRRLPVGPYLYVIDLGDGSPITRGWLYINY